MLSGSDSDCSSVCHALGIMAAVNSQRALGVLPAKKPVGNAIDRSDFCTHKRHGTEETLMLCLVAEYFFFLGGGADQDELA